MNLKLRTGEAFAVACEDPATIEGVHADQVLYIYDEAKTIPPETFDASEGAFSGAGDDTAQEAYALASSTPGPPVGRFYEIHARKPGLRGLARGASRSRTRSPPAASRASGPTSARSSGARTRPSTATACSASSQPPRRTASSRSRGSRPPTSAGGGFDDDPGPLTAVGVDVARSGGDKTVLALRHGWAIMELRHESGQGTMETTGQVAACCAARGVAVVDVIGIGAGVVDRLREQEQQVVAFNASEGTRCSTRAASSASSTAARPPGGRCASCSTRTVGERGRAAARRHPDRRPDGAEAGA
jgi:hypothetical protein